MDSNAEPREAQGALGDRTTSQPEHAAASIADTATAEAPVEPQPTPHPLPIQAAASLSSNYDPTPALPSQEPPSGTVDDSSTSATYAPQQQTYNYAIPNDPVDPPTFPLPQYAGPVADSEPSDDADSALGSHASTRSTSLREQAYAFRHIHGRRYHASQGPDGPEYPLPNDELELDRLDLQHHLFLLTLRDHPVPLHCAPLPKDVQSVLDVGTGTGIWAIDFADQYPSASVVGTDLSPIQPNYVPPNCRFYVEDAEKAWSFSSGDGSSAGGEGPFDYIHGRMLVVGIRNWARFFEQCYANLKPGGWVEMQDLNFPGRCDDDTAGAESPLMEWSGLMQAGARTFGINLEVSNEFPRLLAEAGFQEIRSETHAWPINRWPKDKMMKERGMWVMQNFLQGLHGFSMAYFTRGLGWKPQEVEIMVAKVKEQAMNKKSHVYMPISFFWARKPE